jgi:hypothetical protein
VTKSSSISSKGSLVPETSTPALDVSQGGLSKNFSAIPSPITIPKNGRGILGSQVTLLLIEMFGLVGLD